MGFLKNLNFKLSMKELLYKQNISIMLYLLLLINFYISDAQNSIKIKVYDKSSGEALVGATIINLSNNRFYQTNSYGYALIPTIPSKDTFYYRIIYMGYTDTIINIRYTDSIQRIALTSAPTHIEAVEVKGYNKTPAHGKLQLSAIELKQVPIMFGEADVLKSIQIVPGIQQNREGTSGFSVRGGNFDQNLILLDGVPVYNINHLFGFVSVLSPEAVNHASFYKGGIPARYGNRLSSVLDITLREGNSDHLTGSLGLGILSLKGAIEGPLNNKKGSFIVSARRMPYDIVLKAIQYINGERRWGYFYQDVIAKINFPLNDNNKLFLSTYFGADKLDFIVPDENSTKNVDRMSWGNITTVFRWSNTSVRDLLSNFTLAFTEYNYMKDNRVVTNGLLGKELYYYGYNSSIKDFIVRGHFTYSLNNKHQLQAGIENNYHIFNPGIIKYKDSNSSTKSGNLKYHNEWNIYLEDEFQLGSFSYTLGVRNTYYNVGKKYYVGIQPRLLLNYRLNQTAFSLGYNKMYQFLHLYSNSTIAFPTDMWIPVTANISPAYAHQYSAGIRTMKKWFNVSGEIFFKDMKNVSDYRDGVIIDNNQTNWDEVLSLGRGISYGFETLIDYQKERYQVSLSYTYCRSLRRFSDIKSGQWFPYTYDRPHCIHINAQYKMSSNERVAFTWSYLSGYWTTISQGNYSVMGRIYPDLSNRNNYRTPPTHHLDVSYSNSSKTKWGVSTFTGGVYNIYARKNPFGYTYEINHEDKPRLEFISLFTFVPFFAWEFRFY